MRLRTAVLPVALLLTALAPAAQAASLGVTPRKACYGTGDKVRLVGAGFTPGATASITRDGSTVGTATVNAQGFIAGRATVPSIPERARTSTYTATDAANAANVGSTKVRLSSVRVRVRPTGGDPRRIRRIGASGFTTGKRLYAHVRRGRFANNFSVGRLKGACKRLSVRARLFGRAVPSGTYKVQFDVNRRFRGRKAVQRVAFRVRIFRRPVAASAVAGAPGRASVLGETWPRVR